MATRKHADYHPLSRIKLVYYEAVLRSRSVQVCETLEDGQVLCPRDLASEGFDSLIFRPIGEIVNKYQRTNAAPKHNLKKTGDTESSVNKKKIRITDILER
jgi:hypothetical protein